MKQAIYIARQMMMHEGWHHDEAMQWLKHYYVRNAK